MVKQKNKGRVILLGGAVLVAVCAIYGVSYWKANHQTFFGSWAQLNESDSRHHRLVQQAIEHTAGDQVAPTPDDALVLVAFRDHAGHPLDVNHAYTLEGKDIDAWHWTIAIHEKDGSPIPYEGSYQLLDKRTIRYEDDGTRYRIVLARPNVNKNWLPIGETDEPMVVLSIFQPSADFLAHLGNDVLPVIKKIGRVQSSK